MASIHFHFLSHFLFLHFFQYFLLSFFFSLFFLHFILLFLHFLSHFSSYTSFTLFFSFRSVFFLTLLSILSSFILFSSFFPQLKGLLLIRLRSTFKVDNWDESEERGMTFFKDGLKKKFRFARKLLLETTILKMD